MVRTALSLVRYHEITEIFIIIYVNTFDDIVMNSTNAINKEKLPINTTEKC